MPVNGAIFSTREHVYDFENEASFRINHQNPKAAALIHHPKSNENFKKNTSKSLIKKYQKYSYIL